MTIEDNEQIVASPTVFEEVEVWFTYHPPSPVQVEKYGALRDEAKGFADLIVAMAPPGVERDRALAAVRESVMWANAGIACGGA